MASYQKPTAMVCNPSAPQGMALYPQPPTMRLNPGAPLRGQSSTQHVVTDEAIKQGDLEAWQFWVILQPVPAGEGASAGAPVVAIARYETFITKMLKDMKEGVKLYGTNFPYMRNKMGISEEKLPSTKKAKLPTWAQLKKLTQLADKSLDNTKVTRTTENMLLAALTIVSTLVSLPMSAGAGAINYTYWDYVPFPPLIRVVPWVDNPIEVYVNNSAWKTDDHCPAQPEEEGMMMNISVGYRYPPICLGSAPGCLMPATQNWLVEVPTVSATSRFTYHMVSGMSLRPQVNYLQDPSYQRSLKARPKGKTCPKEIPKGSEGKEVLVWVECVAVSVVILQNNEFGTIIDWAP
ncbi:endogenous retrovirus group K member 19 Env polyprotein-like [Pongo abelii]|uniref:endogenous retrovirus group K member 19 Env polyprotein-like n=1 Tax=Pongo abelii TaxID=9601 RepID=UPI003004143F